MNFIKKNWIGILVCFIIAVPSWLIGKRFPVVGGPIIAILAGMLIALVWTDKGKAEAGIKWTSKIVLQTAVVLLGFGMNLGVILQTGKQSLPIIICTIGTSLLIAWILRKVMKVPANTSILVGVGSSICGGSAIAATAPVIDADDDEVAQAISVIFFFNVLAAIFFPIIGKAIGFDTASGDAFGIFAGTAINDTSSVTAAASTWDSMWNLGSETLNKAVTVKLTRTLDHISACGSSCKTGGKDRAEDKWIQLEKSISYVHSVFCDRIYNHNDLYQSGRKCGCICTVKGAVQILHYHGYGGDRVKQQCY